MPRMDLIELSSGSEADNDADNDAEKTVVVKSEVKRESTTSPTRRFRSAASRLPQSVRDRLDAEQEEIDHLESLLAAARARRVAIYEQALGEAYQDLKPELRMERPSGMGSKSRGMATSEGGGGSRRSNATGMRGGPGIPIFQNPAAMTRGHGSSIVQNSAPNAERRSVISVRSTPADQPSRGGPDGTDDLQINDRMDIDVEPALFPNGLPESSEGEALEASDPNSTLPQSATSTSSVRTPGSDRASRQTIGSASPTSIEGAIQNLQHAAAKFVSAPPIHRSWDRKTISQVIGGGPQVSWPSPNKSKVWPYRITSEYYICIRRDLNQWLPRNPGDRGGLTVFRNKAYHGMIYPLFIQVQRNKWRYMGNYKVLDLPINGGNLSLAQWNQHFTRPQKINWCAHIISKKWGRDILREKKIITDAQYHLGNGLKNSFPAEQLIPSFELGDNQEKRLRLQVRLLEPFEYDRRLYDALVRHEEGGAGGAANAGGGGNGRNGGDQDQRPALESEYDQDEFRPNRGNFGTRLRGGEDSSVPDGDSDADDDEPTSRRVRRKSKSGPARRTKSPEPMPIDDETSTLAPANSESPTSSQRPKRERSVSDDDLYTQPRATARPRTSRSSSVEIVE